MKLYFTKFYFILLLLLVVVKGYGQSPISYTSNPAVGQWATNTTPPCNSPNTHLLNIVHSRVVSFTINGTPQFETKRINNSSFSTGGQIQTTWITDYSCNFGLSYPTYSTGTNIISSQGVSTYFGGGNDAIYRIGLKSNTGDKIAGGSFTVYRTWVAAPTISFPSNNATNVSLTPTLTWQAANGTGIQYRVSVSQNGTTIHPSSGFQSTTSYTVPSGVLQTGQTYQVNVMASFGSSANTSYWSPIATHTFTTLSSAPTVCDTPTGTTENSITSSSAYLDWNTVSSANFYNVRHREQGTSSWTVDAPTSSNFTVTGLLPNTTYEWQVRSSCGGNTSGYSSIRTFTTLPSGGGGCTAPPVPTGLVGSITGSNQIYLTWDSPGAYADNHTVERSTSPTGSWTIVSTGNTQLSYTDNPPTGTYYYRVKGCVNCGQCSAYTSVVGPYSNVPSGGGGCTDTAYEPNGSIGTASSNAFPVTLTTSPYNRTINALISASNDEDFYVLNVSGIGTLTIDLTSLPMDYDLKLYNSSGTEVGSSTRASTNDEQIIYTPVASGSHYIKIFGYGTNDFHCTDTYSLSVLWQPSTPSPTTGILGVTISPTAAITAGAQWRFVGETAWRNSGTNATRTAGAYTIEYKTVTGWTTPANQSGTIVANVSTGQTGIYTQNSPSTGTLIVEITPIAAKNAGGQWRLTGETTWRNGGTQITRNVGTYTIEYKAVTGWTTPPNRTYTFVAGGGDYIEGNYVQNITSSVILNNNASVLSNVQGENFVFAANVTGGNGSSYQLFIEFTDINLEELIGTFNSSFASYTRAITQAGNNRPFRFKVIQSGNTFYSTTYTYSVIEAIIGYNANPQQGLVGDQFRFRATVNPAVSSSHSVFVEFINSNNTIIFTSPAMTTNGVFNYVYSKFIQEPGLNRKFRYRLTRPNYPNVYTPNFEFDVAVDCSNVTRSTLPYVRLENWYRYNDAAYNGTWFGYTYNANLVKGIIIHHPDIPISQYNSHIASGGTSTSFMQSRGVLRATSGRISLLKYNWFVLPNGDIFEGTRGIAWHAGDFNRFTQSICVIGAYVNDTPTEEALASIKLLATLLANEHGISPNSNVSAAGATFKGISGHRDVMSTACPGGNLYNYLQEIRDEVAVCQNINGGSSRLDVLVRRSSLSGANISLKRTDEQNYHKIGQTDGEGISNLGIYPKMQIGDTLLIFANGVDAIKIPVTNDLLQSERLVVPMLESAVPSMAIRYPKVEVNNLNDVIALGTTPNITLSALNANSYQVFSAGTWQNVSPTFNFVGSYCYEQDPNDLEHSSEICAINARFISSLDTAYVTFYMPSPNATSYPIQIIAANEYYGAYVYVNNIPYTRISSSNTTLNVPQGQHSISVIKEGYETYSQQVNGSTTITLNLNGIPVPANHCYVLTPNKLVESKMGVTIRSAESMNVCVDRSLSQGVVGLRHASPTYALTNQGIGNINFEMSLILDYPNLVLDNIYLLKEQNGTFYKIFDATYFNYESSLQKMDLFNVSMIGNQTVGYTLAQRQQAINLSPNLTQPTGYYKTYHKHQLFWYPDSLQIGLKYLSATSPNPNFEYQVIAGGDSVRVKFNNCFTGIAQVTFVAEHDGLTSTNTVSINVTSNSNLATQVTVERDEVCLNEVNNITVFTQIGKKYRLISQGNLIGTPRNGTGSPIVFSTGSLTTAGLNTFLVTVEDITTTCLDTLSTQPTIFVNDLPARPNGVRDYSVCLYETVPTFTTVGTFRKEWHPDSLGTNLLGTGNSYTLPQSTSQIVGTYSVYVFQFDPVTGCRSLPTKVTLKVRPLPNFDLSAMIDTDNSSTYSVVNGAIQLCRPSQIAFNARRVFPTGHSFFWTNTQSVSAQFTATNTTNLILKVTVDSTGCSFSDTLQINFYNPPTANDLNTSIAQYCSGDVPVKIVGSIPREGNGIYAYQWQKRNASTNNAWENIPNATTRDLIFTDSLTQTTAYRRHVSSVCDVLSNIITLQHTPTPKAKLFVNGQAITQNYLLRTCPVSQTQINQQNDTIRATTTSGELWWYVNNILYSTSRSFIVIDQNFGNADIKVVAKNGICEDTTYTVSIRKEPRIEFFFRANKTTICDNENATLTMEILSPSSNQDYTFEWFKDGQSMSSGTNRTLETNEAGEYQVKISTSTCELMSHTVSIDVLPTPNIGMKITIDGTEVNVTDTIKICQGAVVEISPSSATPNTDYSWLLNNRTNTNGTLRITTNSTVQLRASNGTCSKQSELVTVIFDSNVVPSLSQVREVSCKSDLAFEVQSSITGRFEVTSSDTSFVVNGNRLRINPQTLPAGNYTIKSNYAGTNACLHPDAVATFSIKEELIIPTIIERDGVLVVDSVMNNYTYNWEYSENNAEWVAIGTGNSISLTKNGFYRVKVSLTNGETCFVYSESSSITSIEEPNDDEEEDATPIIYATDKLYPNPSQGNFTLELSNEWDLLTTKIQITDALGRVIMTKNIENYQTHFSYNFASGIYFIQIQNEKQTLTLKLIIQK